MSFGLPGALPSPRTPDPFTAPTLRWGVMGTGWIADRFVRAVKESTGQVIAAVSSRSIERSRSFADHHEIVRAYGSYEELVEDPAIDVVYVALNHNAHHAGAMLALKAGKHVVIEKPLALNAQEATEIAEVAAARGLFCVEALWTFFLPKLDIVRRLLEDDVLGEVRTVIADNGEYFRPDHRIFRADLAGGPLLDLGTYPVSLATWVLGEIASVKASGQAHPAGVNGQAGALLTDRFGNQGVVHTTLLSNTPTAAVLCGTRGTLTMQGPFYHPGALALSHPDGSGSIFFDEERIAHGALFWEAAEAARCIGAGLLESPLRPLADSISMLRVMDEMRRQCGIAFAGEDFEQA